jgi:very-short-patch-repair endonuclease
MNTYNDNLHNGANPKLFEYARGLKKEATEAERKLWERLRNKKLNGLKFRRQHPLNNYIVDFYCYEKKLVIEVDGTVHATKENREYDRGRTAELNELGITVLRFWNEEVIGDIEDVVRRIMEAVK